jgi:acyl-CoA synthetase (AMP-forming)/AMP-acid ligase II
MIDATISHYRIVGKPLRTPLPDERGRAFLRTGDMGRFDGDGYLYILDRVISQLDT